MRVLVVRNSDASTNASVRRVVTALLEGGHTPSILSRVRENKYDKITIEEDYIDIDGNKVKNYIMYIPASTEKGLKNLPILYKYISTTRYWIEDNIDKFDCIHAFDLDAGLSAKPVARAYNKKLVYHIADFYVDSRAKIPRIAKNVIRDIEYSIIDKADATIICTEERAEQIKGSNPKKLVVVHNSPVVRDDIYKKIREKLEIEGVEKSRKENRLRLCYIGMLSKRRMIDAILEVAARNNDIDLVLGGSGDLAKLCEEYSQKYGNITYLGKVSYEDTFEVYEKCNCMFAIYNPEIRNHRYSAANKIYEAMLLAKPIIVAKNTSMDKIVDRYDIGFSVGHRMEEIEKVVIDIKNNLEILDSKAENMKNIYDKYSWIEMKSRIINLYKEIQV